MNATVECQQCLLGLAAEGRCPFTSIRVRAGSLVQAQGVLPDRVAFVKDGLLTLSSVNTDGAERDFAIRGPGAAIGLEGVNDEVSSAEVHALTDARLCVLSTPQFKAWLGPDRSPAKAALSLALAEGSRWRSDHDWRQGPCLERVAKLLLSCPEDGFKGLGVEQKQQMARLLGMRPETFSRCLKKLETRGAIGAKTLRVRDRGLLEAAANAPA